MKKYIGVKLIEAEPLVKDGREGYKVRYPDGYESWSPKETFEEAYIPEDAPYIKETIHGRVDALIQEMGK